MNKNDEIRELVEEILPLCTMADKNVLIGMLSGILWQQKKSSSRYYSLRLSLKCFIAFCLSSLGSEK